MLYYFTFFSINLHRALIYVMIAEMKKEIRQLAIIGPTASGKSDLAIAVAREIDAIILSLDSLSLYREIDIASAKPDISERAGIPHFGIDILYPDEAFDVTLFAKVYQQAYQKARSEEKNLIIVGGTGFYLKVLIDGISPLPKPDPDTLQKIKREMPDREKIHTKLRKLDPLYMENIKAGDSYRIEKALEIYYSTGKIPSQYFRENPPESMINGDLPLYRIAVEKALLRERIAIRTEKMIKQGLIDEVAYLEKKYTRKPNPMKAIGIRETLDYLDGRISKMYLAEKITTNTARLAKRQTTFNRSQFGDHVTLEADELKKRILDDLRG